MPLRESGRDKGRSAVTATPVKQSSDFASQSFLGKIDPGGLVKGPMDMKVNQATTCLRESHNEIKLDPQ